MFHYDGDEYNIVHIEQAYRVQREGGDAYWVRPWPPYCECGDWTWKRAGLLPVPCRHVRAVREFLKNESSEATHIGSGGPGVAGSGDRAGEQDGTEGDSPLDVYAL